MIDYSLLSSASEHYTDLKFARIEVPWLVSKPISDLTAPLGANTYIVQKDTEHKQKAFIASGEQGFLYLINKGHIPSHGMYQTTTPCLRDDSWDATHMKGFIKLELIKYSTTENFKGIDMVFDLVDAAVSFFKKHVDESRLKIVASMEDSYCFDVTLDDIEIGSYGYRSCMFCNWIYGTGIAEPRFSRLVKQREFDDGRISS